VTTKRLLTAVIFGSLLGSFAGWLIFAAAQAQAQAQSAAQNRADVPVPVNRPSWRRRNEKVNERAKQGDVDLIFIGDSITEGWIVPADSSWPEGGGGEEIWKKYYGRRKAMNAGISGDWTQHVLWRMDSGNLDGIKPKLAVLMVGTNNALWYPPEEVAGAIKDIVAKVREKLPQTKVLLLAILPCGDLSEANREDTLARREKNAKASKLASEVADDKMVFYMDIGARFMDADGNIRREIMPDFLHPNAKGYEIWGRAIEAKVAELMGEKK
jgi:beta-glucosidase